MATAPKIGPGRSTPDIGAASAGDLYLKILAAAKLADNPLRLAIIQINPELEKHQVTRRLGDRSFTFNFFWVARTSAWYMHLSTFDGRRLLSGQRLSPGYALLRDHWTPDFPPGELIFWDKQRVDTTPDPTHDEAGSRFVLVFATFADLVQIYGL